MTAALAIADHGFKVDLVEKSDSLGGMAKGVDRTIEGTSVADVVDKLSAGVENRCRTFRFTKTPRLYTHNPVQAISSPP